MFLTHYEKLVYKTFFNTFHVNIFQIFQTFFKQVCVKFCVFQSRHCFFSFIVFASFVFLVFFFSFLAALIFLAVLIV